MEFVIAPAGVSTASAYLLIGLSCFTSMLTASIGIGGGTVLLAAMAQVVPIHAVIPVHGVVQLGSNTGRAAILIPQVSKMLVVWFLCGSLVGSIVGGYLVVDLPVAALKLILGSFILFSVWSPSIPGLSANPRSLLGGGFISTVLTMFVGATGPFVLALLRVFSLNPQALVATAACCLTIQHLVKVLAFGLLGFAFAPYIPLMILMVISGFIGTLMGKRVLLRVDNTRFEQGLEIILSVLAIKLLFDGIN